MSCEHTSPKLLSKFFCTVCQTYYGETEITVEVMAEALWRSRIKPSDAVRMARPPLLLKDGEPCAWDEQSEELREWCRCRIRALMVAAKEVVAVRIGGAAATEGVTP